MYNKSDYFSLSQAHYSFNSYMETMISYWYKDKFGAQPDFLYDDIVWKDDYKSHIIVTFSNGDKVEIERTYFYAKRDDDGNEYPVIEMQWYSDYYDGPLSGLAVFNGDKVWFECSNMDELIDIRTFKLYELSEKELAVEEYWHGLFRKHVGTHCDYGTEREQFSGGNDPDVYWELSKNCKPRDYSNNNCLGTFDECFFTTKE